MRGSPPPPRWPAPGMEPDNPCSQNPGQGCVGTRRTLDALSKVHHVNIITLDILWTSRYQGLSRWTAIMGFIDGTKLGDVKILAHDVHAFKRLSELPPRCSLKLRTSSPPDSELSAPSPTCVTAKCLPFRKDGGASAESGHTNRSWGATCSRLFIKILRKGHGTKCYYSRHKTSVKLRNKTQCQLSHLEPNPREITVLDHKINPIIFSNIWSH